MPNNISLLPEEIRRKEEEEKRRAAEARAEPEFSMHLPEERKANGNGLGLKKEAAGVSLGVSIRDERPRGEFKIVRRAPVAPPQHIEKRKPVNLHRPPADVSLISENYSASVKKEFCHRIRILSSVLIVLLIVLALGFVGIKFYEKSLAAKYNILIGTVSQTMSEINSFRAEQQQSIKPCQRAKFLRELLGKRVCWTNLLAELEHNTVAGVSYISLVAKREGRVLLATEAKSYSDAAQELKLLEAAPFVKTAAMTKPGTIGAEKNGVAGRFDINLILQDSVLYQ